jgi:citrate lyase subunit beta/citryl-CoA lyase
MSTARAHLYVPADREKLVLGASSRGADALIFDLEDSVSASRKPMARELLRAVLAARDPAGGEVWIRVNALRAERGRLLDADLDAVVGLPIDGIIVAKVESPADLDDVDHRLRQLEQARRCATETTVVALVESATGLLACEAIARHRRVARVQLGEADLAASLGLDVGPDESELLMARSTVVAASAAAGIAPPIGSVFVQISDSSGLHASSERLRRLGFAGRAVIHPSQIPIVQSVFTLSDEKRRAAQDLVDRYNRAAESGAAVVVDVDGRMVDEAVVRSARRLLGEP